MENEEIKKNDDGEIVKVVATTAVQETLIDSTELLRQISIYQTVLDGLNSQLAQVQALEDTVNPQV